MWNDCVLITLIETCVFISEMILWIGCEYVYYISEMILQIGYDYVHYISL